MHDTFSILNTFSKPKPWIDLLFHKGYFRHVSYYSFYVIHFIMEIQALFRRLKPTCTPPQKKRKKETDIAIMQVFEMSFVFFYIPAKCSSYEK